METFLKHTHLGVLNVFCALSLSPLLFGIINRVKAVFAGRKGQPLLQLYYDIYKLFHKNIVYSKTTTWIFRITPIIGLSITIIALLFLPCFGKQSLISFNGDLVFFVYILGLSRFLMVISALDTGSSFEGMGASREVQFAIFTEPALFLALSALVKETNTFSLSAIYSHINLETWIIHAHILALVSATFLIVFLAENCRVPFDDPNTHLELTMIHEVMVLDNSGPDLACILYTSALKLWIFGTLLVGVLCPINNTGNILIDIIIFLISMAILAVIVGIIESAMARFRFFKIPQLLITAIALSVLALMLQIM